MSPKWKKALKIISIMFAFIAIPFIILVLFSATRPGAPPFDDSKLAVHRPDVPKGENGFPLFAETVGTTDDYFDDRNYFKNIYEIADDDKRFRNISDKDFKRLENKYGKMLRGIEKSVEYKYFISSENKITPDHEFPPGVRFLAAKSLSTLNLAFAWHDFRNNKVERGMQRIESILRLGMLLQNSYGSLAPYFIGISIQKHCLDEINALLDHNLIPEVQLPRLLKILRENNDFITGIHRTIAAEYSSQKYIHEYFMKNEESSFFERISTRLFYDENMTRKKQYDFWISYYEWAGQPYNTRPHVKIEIPKTISDHIKSYLSGNIIGDTLYLVAMPNFARGMEQISFYEIQINTLNAKIALLQYSRQNNRLPQNLDKLVPKYISAVPRDPFDGKPLRYDPEKNIIYSVGYNLKDDGGVASKHIFELKRTKPQDQKDLVLHIIMKFPPVKD